MDRNKETKRALLTILKTRVGEDQKISREDLLSLLNCETRGSNYDDLSDRYMRQMIADLREEPRGCWIVAAQEDRGGYFWASSLNELDKFTSHDLLKAKTLFQKVSNQRKNAGLVVSPQIRMEGL